jgi:hypothetical protein
MSLIADTSVAARAPSAAPLSPATAPGRPPDRGLPSGSGVPEAELQNTGQQIQQTYATQGAAAAAKRLALAQTDTRLTTEQRKALAAQCRPVIDKIAQSAGENARRTDLPADGPADKTTGIDTQGEYKSMVTDLATATDAPGDAAEAARVADSVLHALPLAPNGQGADRLGLFGDSLRTLPPDRGLLRDVVAFELGAAQPANAPTGSVLAAPQPARVAAATSLTGVPPPGQPWSSEPDAKAYTDFQVTLAADLLADARRKEKILNAAPPHSDAYDKAAADYRSAVDLAIRKRTEANAAIEAELRSVYKGDAANTLATDDMAHQIANRYKLDPEAQLGVKDALQTVKTETPRQRETSIKLYELHRAEDTLTRLQVQYQASGTAPPAYKQAVADYAARQQAVMKALDQELVEGQQGLTDPAAKSQAVDDTAQRLLDRYEGDGTMGRLVVAARIVRRSVDAGVPGDNDANMKQMVELGRSMPATTDTAIRSIVMNHPAIKAIVDTYVDRSAQSVTDAYDKAVTAYKTDFEDATLRGDYVPPATAAMNTLTALTDPVNHPEVSPEITARIINRLMTRSGAELPGTLDRVIDDVSYNGDNTNKLLSVDGRGPGFEGFDHMLPENRRGFQMADKQKIITGLSLVVDRAAQGSVPDGKMKDGQTGMRWESAEVKTAVESVGQQVAFNMAGDLAVRSDFNHGFTRAIAGVDGPAAQYTDAPTGQKYTINYAGGTTLALEVAHQEIGLQDTVRNGDTLVSDTMNAVGQGIADLKTSSATLFDEMHKKMAALEVPWLRYGQTMTPEQQQAAMNKVFEHAKVDPHDEAHAVEGYAGALSDFVAGKKALDQRGFEIKRVDDAVDQYGTLEPAPADWDTNVYGTYEGDNVLADLPGYADLAAKRGALISDEQVATMIAGSEPAQLAARDKAVHASLNWMRDSGVVPPAAAGPVPLPLFLQWTGDFKEHLVEDKYLKGIYGGGVSRLGNRPALAHLSWGAVGSAQMWLTAYLYHNVSMPPGQEWRKDALLFLVGGFAAIKAYQSGTILAHQGAQLLQKLPPGIKNVVDRSGRLPGMEEFFRQHSEFTRTAGAKSIGAFGLLHASAAVWDASRVWSEVQNWKDGKVVDQRNFWTALVNLGNDWTIAALEFKTAYGLLRYPTSAATMTPELRAEIAAGKRAIPLAEAEAAGKIFSSKLARYGFKALYGPGNLYELGSKLLVSGLQKMGVRAALAEIPGVGTLATVAWTVTDLVNWIGNEKKVHKLLENIDQDFLTGAGISPDRAKVLADRSLGTNGWTRWLQGTSITEGLLNAYTEMGGDPAGFVDYLNSIPVTSLTTMRNGLRDLADVEGDIPQTADNDYWMLPADPDDPAQRQFNPHLTYNQTEHRWEDTKLNMCYLGRGEWGTIGETRTDQRTYYKTLSHHLETGRGADYQVPPQAPKSRAGVLTWMLGSGLPLPPKPVDPKSMPSAPVDTSATTRQNTYTVQKGDSVWRIAGNDVKVVQWIYGHNPWLNERMQRDTRPRNVLGGQNPNYINEGESLILPDGYTPPAS